MGWYSRVGPERTRESLSVDDLCGRPRGNAVASAAVKKESMQSRAEEACIVLVLKIRQFQLELTR